MKCIMRNLCKYIIATVTLAVSALSFGSVALAQQAPVVFDKYVSGPNEDGVFTINLEAYAPGSIEVRKDPFDVVLVLDRSGSMEYNMAGQGEYQYIALEDQRISKLKESVQGFVQYLKDNPPDQEDARGGHRIAFVWFSDNVSTSTGLNVFQKVTDLTTYKASGSGNGYQQARVLLGNNNNLLLNNRPEGGTMSNRGMQQAYSILNAENTENAYSNTPKRQRIVVFFTDGEPGSYGWSGNDGTSTANGCIRAAYNIKNSSAFGATIYSIGLFNISRANRTTTYLAYTSSDFKDKQSMPNNNSWVYVSNLYSLLVSDSEQLNAIFTTIAENTSKAASGSSVLVDIVTSDFSISAPVAGGLGSIKVWEVPCTQSGPNSPISFSPKYAADGTTLLWHNITSSVGLDQTRIEQGVVSVTGYDYGANWCGWNAETGTVHGNKLLLEIPISVNDNIVGGPSTQTNLPGSGITVKNASGEEIGNYYFPIPVVKVPVTIWIKKEGLLSSTKNSAVQGHEDNAVFTIRKTKFLGLYETDSNGDVFEGAKRIEYTYSKTGNKKFIVKGVETEIVWTTFTKVSVNMKEGDQDGIVKISGLDADYIYRIEEDAWAHLGYDFDPDAAARYTLEWNGTEYIEPTNPFVFSNTSKTNAFYSEDVVRNVFNPGSAAPTTP